MRLIDKDNLRKPTKGMFIYQDEFEDDVQHVAFEAYTKDDIEREPTVEAIPIEWLINKCNEADNMGWGIDDWSEKDCYIYVFEQWEKENESNVSN